MAGLPEGLRGFAVGQQSPRPPFDQRRVTALFSAPASARAWPRGRRGGRGQPRALHHLELCELRHEPLRAGVGLEHGAVAGERHRAVQVVVGAHPAEQVLEVVVLLLLGAVLVRLPRTSTAVGDADVLAGLQEDQQRPVGQHGFHQVAVAAVDDPVVRLAAELREVGEHQGVGPLDGHLVGLPHQRIEIQQRHALRAGERLRERRFARSGVAEDDDSHSLECGGDFRIVLDHDD